MRRFIFESWLRLVYIDLVLCTHSFTALHELIHRKKVKDIPRAAPLEPGKLCRAMDLACIFYFKRVRCLQRSAATTCLLRRHGWDAHMVIGVQILPFRSHAWVEIDGVAVNDKHYVRDLYTVLQQC